MQKLCVRLIMLGVVVCMQSCCWSQCPPPEKSAVQWHTPILKGCTKMALTPL
jgi:hypothetical protein